MNKKRRSFSILNRRKNKKPLVKIAVDLMGNDHGPDVMLGACEAILTLNEHISIGAFGSEGVDQLRCSVFMKRFKDRFHYSHSTDVVSQEDSLAVALRKVESSMARAVESVASGLYHGVLSCGSTSALVGFSLSRLKRLGKIRRPAILSRLPGGHQELGQYILDVGSNVNETPQMLVDYALLGHHLLRSLGRKGRIGLVSHGVEDSKGTVLIKDADYMLKQLRPEIDYIGKIEPDYLFTEKVDVLITDGHTGNIMLKACERTGRYINQRMRSWFKQTWRGRFLQTVISLFRRDSLATNIDPSKTSGGIFLGVNGVVVKSHAQSDQLAIVNTLMMAYDAINGRLIERLQKVDWKVVRNIEHEMS